ncbi:MAG: hypothetical protein M3P33_04385 [bacterium]|nr:hypothetical protein [bacterium]
MGYILFIPQLLFFIWMLFAVLSIAKGAPFVVTKKERVEKIIELAQIKQGELVADIGSGDGTIIIALARAGAIAHGYEINLLLVLWSWIRIRKLGLERCAFVHWSNMWTSDFSKYDVVVVYGITHIMKDLEINFPRPYGRGFKLLQILDGFALNLFYLAQKYTFQS